MIHYDTDGVSLTYTTAQGAKVTASPRDTEHYMELLVVMEAQEAADGENNTAVDHYRTALANAQVDVDAGRMAVNIPTKPQRKIVADDGAVTYADFVPALPDLKPLAVSAGAGAIKSAPAPDRLDVILSLLAQFGKTLSAIQLQLKPA